MEDIENYKKAGEIHNNISKEIYEYVKPGITDIDIVKKIEEDIKTEINKIDIKQVNNGIAFPVGVSINNCVAHHTPNYNDKPNILKIDDIIKIDYGVHINGNIVDSAFTLYFNDIYKEFINTSKDLTRYVIKNTGVDVILGEIGDLVEEYVSGLEIDINGIVKNVRVMSDLSGHKLGKYVIHAGKAVPNKSIKYMERMKEGEYYAIEPFLTTGNGISIIKNDVSHYMININNKYINIKNKEDKKLYEFILKKYKTLPFCKRWLNEDNSKYNDNIINNLVKNKIINEYPPIYDINNSIVSQFEHTIYIADKGVINITDNSYY